MSRIGKRPIPVPKGVEVKVAEGRFVTVKGPKGKLERQLPEMVSVSLNESEVCVERADESRMARERHGLSRTLIANMIEGVSKGFESKLEITGVGYRAQVQGRNLVLSMGYSHPVEIVPPEGIQVAVEKNTSVTISGFDKEAIGNLAAKIRSVRPPEPYKGKGIRYAGEQIRRKAGKSGKK